jgi:hypothetical protein
VERAPEQPVGPVRQQVADVDQHRRARVVLGPRWADGDGRPDVIFGQELETRLAAEAEEQGDGAVVRVGTGADVRGGVGGCVWGWVAEEAEDGAGCSLGCVVRRGEEVVDLRDVMRSAQTSLWESLTPRPRPSR